ncbi:metal ABC transporter solute-binding protein, Zn/Mn family [Rothia sp. P7181]|uniref:metal ABC transporter solute-binding protein, Zn/Mn family n=1 Tax=Rothia sp. P7181 TaxID=3402663 RepID=UPI003AD8A825
MKKFLTGIAFLSIASLSLSACGSTVEKSEESAKNSEKGVIKVVTSTDVYANIVESIGGDTVEVTPLINSTSEDPHSYEATSADRLSVKDAQLVVLNGGGYDQFLENMAGQDHKDQKVLNAVEISGLQKDDDHAHEHDHEHGDDHAHEHGDEHAHSHEHAHEHGDEHSHEHGDDHSHEHGHHHHHHGDFNEHVWYDFVAMQKLAGAIAEDLAEEAPEHAEQYRQAAGKFKSELGELISQTRGINAEGKKYIATEPVPGYLLTMAGFSDATPSELTSAVESGSDIAPLIMNQVKEELQEKQVGFFAYNEQTSSPQTEELLKDAQEAQIPHVSFTETLPEGKDYLGWMKENIENIKKSLTS